MTKSILIIEDEPINQILYEEFLKHSGYKVILADSGVEGLKMAFENPPDFIILDYRLPKMNGDAVCKQLRGNPKTANIPMIVVSASCSIEEMAARCPHVSKKDLYLKPINHREIKQRIDSELLVV